MKIVIDTREQEKLEFDVPGLEIENKALLSGDYGCWHGDEEDKTLFERKSIADLFGSFTGDRYEKEKDKWTRAKEAGYEYIIAIESTASTVRQGYSYTKGGVTYPSKKDGLSQVKQLMTISRKYDIPIWFCNGRRDMAFLIYEYFLSHERIS